MCEVIKLEYTRRAVPKDGLRALDNVCVDLLCLRTNVKTLPSIRNLIHRSEIGLCVVAEVVSDLCVNSQNQVNTLVLSLLHQLQSQIQLVILADRLTDLTALSLCEGIGHTACDDQVVHLVEQVLDDLDLRRNLRTTHDCGERTLDVVEHLINGLHLFLHQVTEHLVISVEIVSDQCRRSVRTVSCTECVVYVAVSVSGQLLRELFLALFHSFLSSLLLLVGSVLSQTSGFALLLSVEAQVLQQQSLTRLQSGSLHASLLADAVVSELYVDA